MTEAVISHWKMNNSAYPRTFVLTPARHRGYVAVRRADIRRELY
ncbi:hypothetical protein NU688_30245 [Variovorax sp. ZS18.2.2]|nr:hypothetical protein [Variovorax sp. ZS18.2.2]